MGYIVPPLPKRAATNDRHHCDYCGRESESGDECTGCGAPTQTTPMRIAVKLHRYSNNKDGG